MSYWRLFFHIVWSTKKREMLITPTIEPFLYDSLGKRCREDGGYSLAINGMPDHVHVVAIIPPKVALAEFVGHLKGSSSRFISLEYDIPFEWQPGYGVFSVSERLLPQAIAYVRRQKAHHANGKTIPRLERSIDEEDGPSIISAKR